MFEGCQSRPPAQLEYSPASELISACLAEGRLPEFQFYEILREFDKTNFLSGLLHRESAARRQLWWQHSFSHCPTTIPSKKTFPHLKTYDNPSK
jgi:hypothetical protein